MKIGVLADDLTGAFDTGVQFRSWGLKVEFRLTGYPGYQEVKDADVVVINTDSRANTRESAYEKVYNAAKSLSSLGIDFIYKKIDSTLRGNLGAELDAVTDALQTELLLISPSYPSYGRTTIDGKILVNNTPLEDTEYATELPTKSSKICEIIRYQSTRKIGHISLKTVESDVDEILSKIEALYSEGVEIIIIDSTTESHLQKIAQLSRRVKVVAGSAGLASEIPPGLGLKNVNPILSICGSIRGVSQIQSTNLHDRLGFNEISLNVNSILKGQKTKQIEIKRCVDKATTLIKNGMDVSITTFSKDEATQLNNDLNQKTESTYEVRKRIVESIGVIASQIVDRTNISGIILTGGETSLSVFENMGVDKVVIVDEVEPGIPLITIKDGMMAVTKAGGFGTDDSLIHAAQKLRRLMTF